jgi:hypothetical protein
MPRSGRQRASGGRGGAEEAGREVSQSVTSLSIPKGLRGRAGQPAGRAYPLVTRTVTVG